MRGLSIQERRVVLNGLSVWMNLLVSRKFRTKILLMKEDDKLSDLEEPVFLSALSFVVTILRRVQK